MKYINNFMNQLGKKTILTIFSYIVTAIITWLATNRRRVKISFQLLFRWNKEIRISCAYLFRIKHEDKYVLIKGNRIDQYQPVGGVYKYYDSFKSIKDSLDITDEQEPSFYENKDLRIRIKGKNILKFLDWFDSKKNREVSVNREFIEEIGLNDDLNQLLIRNTKFEFIKENKEPITYSKYFKIDEIKIFDIFDVEISKAILDEIIKRDNIQLISKDDIEKECVFFDDKSRKIAMTAKYIL